MLIFCNSNAHLLTNLGGRVGGVLNRTTLLTSSRFGESMERHARQKMTVPVPYPKLDEYALKAIKQPAKGKIYDKKPFKFYCEKGKTYVWCTCGWSHKQPFCDGTHKSPHLRIKIKPLLFVCVESGDYWFCNCKQTSQRPFCDGTHRSEEIQAAIRS